jgi:hypothetical protein
VIAKYMPGDAEFDLPQRLIDLYNAKDYGEYGVNGTMPVCFTSACTPREATAEARYSTVVASSSGSTSIAVGRAP